MSHASHTVNRRTEKLDAAQAEQKADKLVAARQKADHKLIRALIRKEDKKDMAAQKLLDKKLAKNAAHLEKQNEKAELCWMKHEDPNTKRRTNIVLVPYANPHAFRHPYREP